MKTIDLLPYLLLLSQLSACQIDSKQEKSAQDNSGYDQQSVGNSETGKGLFNRYCASCHGVDARGREEVGSPNINGKTAGEIVLATRTVSYMRSLEALLSEQNILDIAAHLE